MTRDRSLTLAAAVLAAVVAFALAPASALAAGQPSFAPATILSEGFEGALPSGAYVDWILPSPGDPSPAYWGAVTQRAHSGLKGLWCAGSIPGATTTTAWTTFGGKYPVYTAGMAVFDVPALADYYSAGFSYWYTMPTLGASDGDALNVQWSSSADGVWDYHAAQPVVSAWTQRTYSLSVPTPGGAIRPVDLSRTAGTIRFLFRDDVSDVENPATGEGPTIDDLLVSGYKYGPVRGLGATVDGSGVHLSWTVPARSTALLAADEERPLAYRVWRSPDNQPYAWRELTDARITGTTFDDSTPANGSSRYIVQAWDPDTGTGYGELDVAAGAVATVSALNPAPVSTIAVDPAAPGAGGTYVTSPTVTVSRDIDGTTFWRWDGGSFASTTSVSFQVPVLAGTHTLEAYSVSAASVSEAVAVTRSITVGPAPRTKPYVSVPYLSSTSPYHGRAFYYRGSLSPKHTATTTVRLYVYRLVGHTYHSYRTYTVTMKAGATSYSLRASLSLKGTYRIRAYHSDTAHLATYSSYRTFKVR